MRNPVVAFCGMTHLGLSSLVAGAAKGFEVVGFDPDASLVEGLQRGELPVTEPDLDDLLAAHGDNIVFTHDEDELSRCDVVYVAPDVPTDDEGKSDLSGINSLLDLVEPALRGDAVLVILSQVNPGFTRARGREVGPLYYQVETLIFGRAVERALHPERYIVGCADPAAGLPEHYAAFLAAHDCPILPMRYESAELAKISINMCLVASISVANTMAEVCEHIGADWSEIVPALKLDRRIGEFSYIIPGLGISGGNLERDLASVIRMADEHDTDAGVVRAWISNSTHRKGWPYRALKTAVLDANPQARIAVLGLAYKENTHSTKNSPALVLLKNLNESRTATYDPVVEHSSSSALEAAAGADAVAIMTPWPEFRDIKPAELAETMNGKTVVDPYGMLDAAGAVKAGLKVITLGVAA